MFKMLPIRLCFTVMLAGCAWAQGTHNIDVSFSVGPAWIKSQTIPGIIGHSRVIDDSWGASTQFSFGYQVARSGTARIFAEYCAGIYPAIGEGVAWYETNTLGMRVAFPVHARVSLFADAGGGFGDFTGSYTSPDLRIHTPQVRRSVFTFGGGIDFRLTRLFSLRAQIKDAVSRPYESGAPGRHHAMPLLGVAVHL